MIDKIKSYFYNKRINSDIKNNKTKRQLINLKQAYTVGIAFDATNLNAINTIRDLEQKLIKDGKRVSVFGYIDSNDERKEHNIISNKDLNWYGYPDNEKANTFNIQNFDILFGIFNESSSPLSVIFANSKSKMRISLNNDKNLGLSDIVIETKTNSLQEKINSLIEFVENVKTA